MILLIQKHMEDIKNRTRDFLRLSEKYTKTDMVYLTSGGFWLSAGQVISSASAFLLSIAFANLLPKETYGVYRYILSMVSLLTIPALPGITTAVTRAVSAGFDGTLVASIKAKIRWGFFSSLASLGVAGYYYFNHNNTLAISFLVAAVFLPFMDAFGLYTALLNGKKKYWVWTKYGAITQIVSVASLIAALFLTKNLFFILLAYFVSWTLLRYIFLKITLRKFIASQTQDPKALSYGKHLSLMKVANITASYIDRLFVFHFLGPISLAVYSFAIAVPEQIKGALSFLDTLAFPKFVARDAKEIKSSFKTKFLRLLLLGILIVGVYVLAAPLIYKIFFPQYKDSIFYSQLFALSMLNLIFFPATTALKAKKKIKELYISNTVGPIFQIAIMLIFIIWKGLLGLIIARIISRFFGGLLDTFLFYRSPVNEVPDNNEEPPQPVDQD